MSPFRAALLDIDGTLIDSNEAHARAWARIFEEEGHPDTLTRVRRLIGAGSDKLLERILGAPPSPELRKRLGDRKKKLFLKEYLPGLRPFAGARELLERMREEGFELALATSAAGDEARALLELLGDPEQLAIVMPDARRAHEVGSKPEPGPLVAALERLGVEASAALMLGDTPYDSLAARETGAGFVGVLSGGWSREELQPAEACYADVGTLLREFEASPYSRLPERARSA